MSSPGISPAQTDLHAQHKCWNRAYKATALTALALMVIATTLLCIGASGYISMLPGAISFTPLLPMLLGLSCIDRRLDTIENDQQKYRNNI